ncbi:unnamed protein product [Urochloa decumbens]|uniref:Uncharacterized protein n=1 Tax=Urochloa decumbens TaxID=240449 RepID=A0ABC9BW09_9POAL
MAAAAVVSVSMGVLKPVLAKLATLMGDEYKKIKGLRKKVTFLQRELADMDALLEKMDSADELDPQAKNWRKDIIEMSYNIEYCIDDFMQRVGQADNKVGIFRKAFKYLRTFKDRYNLANQFEKIKAQVMEASERRKRYMLDQSISVTASIVVDPRLSAIYKESASLVGIDTQKNELVNWAMDKEQQLKVMAVVGFGGLGKTTLVNEVYREVGGKFDCKAFVSVSQKPEMVGLFNSLLLQLGLGTYSDACQLQDPINKLRRHLQDKRYLVVVDDLWNIEHWNVIRCAFPQNSQHGRIIITTRIESVARECWGNQLGHIHNMMPLSEQDSRKLFFDRLFVSEDAFPSELKNASCEILKKCGGLPLAIITIAGMLACQPTKLEELLEYIRNSLSSNKFATDFSYKNMMYILDLSYKNLPHHLKACFLYLGSYPEDHRIGRLELIRRWVAEGFVSNSARQDVWDVAESYFNELLNRSMIQPIYGDFVLGVISGCRVHDMLLELIVTRCKEDNFLCLVNDPQGVVEVQDKVIRRLNIVGIQGKNPGENVAVTTAMNLAKIRTLTILGESNWIPSLLDFKFVRVLSVSWHPQMPIDLNFINQLSQLRYVKVTGSGKMTNMLPCQLQGLQFLETLDLSGMPDCSISLEIADVPCLSHLLMPSNTRLPDWIGKVKSLRTLSTFSLPMDSLEGIIGLGELTALSVLNLCIPMGVEGSIKATLTTALSTCLKKLSNLKVLFVGPDDMCEPAAACCCDALSSLSPSCRNIEKLYLAYFCTFSRVPRWIGHLHSLRHLSFGAKQVLQEDVAVIGKLPYLDFLYLWIPGVPVDRIMIQESTGFLALKRFCFECDGMSFLTFEAGAMPGLRDLELYFNLDEWDKAAPAGLQHLPSLMEIQAQQVSYPSKQRRLKVTDQEEGKKADDALARSVFQEAADALPTRPALHLGRALTPRAVEEKDWVVHHAPHRSSGRVILSRINTN